MPYKQAADAAGETRAAIESVDANIVRLIGNAEGVAPSVFALIGAMLTKIDLEPRLREAAILLVATRTGAAYEWTQHAPIAERVGVTAEQVAAIESGETDAACLDEPTRATLAFVDELLASGRPSEPTFDRLAAAGLGPREIVELALLAGCYRMLADVMTSLDIDEDPPVPPEVFARTMKFMNG